MQRGQRKSSFLWICYLFFSLKASAQSGKKFKGRGSPLSACAELELMRRVNTNFDDYNARWGGGGVIGIGGIRCNIFRPKLRMSSASVMETYDSCCLFYINNPRGQQNRQTH